MVHRPKALKEGPSLSSLHNSSTSSTSVTRGQSCHSSLRSSGLETPSLVSVKWGVCEREGVTE